MASLVPRPCAFVACSMKFTQNSARPGNEANKWPGNEANKWPGNEANKWPVN